MVRMLSELSVVSAAKEQVWCDLGDEAAILHLTSGVYYGLNETGARIWTLLQEPRLVCEIRDALVKEYDLDPDRCERDLLALLDELASAALIEVRDAPRR
jgi:hypothetical protein